MLFSSSDPSARLFCPHACRDVLEEYHSLWPGTVSAFSDFPYDLTWDIKLTYIHRIHPNLIIIVVCKYYHPPQTLSRNKISLLQHVTARLTEGLGTRISMKRTPLLKCPYDQIFGRPHFYIFVKSMTFLLNFLKSKFEVLTSMESYLFRRFLYKIIRPPLIKHVPEVTSKLKTTWLIILI